MEADNRRGPRQRGRRRRVTRTIRGSKRDAIRSLSVLVAEVQSGERRPVATPDQPGGSFVVDDLIDWYLEFARNTRGLERTTVFGYREVFRNWLRDQIGHVHADTVALGGLAEGAGVPHLLLTHLIPQPRSDNDAAAFADDVRQGGYTGEVTVGEDLTTIDVHNLRSAKQ